jgi:hypothetical protein
MINIKNDSQQNFLFFQFEKQNVMPDGLTHYLIKAYFKKIFLNIKWVWLSRGNPVTGPGGPIGWVEVYINSFLTSTLEGVSGQHHTPAAFTPGKDPVPIVQEAGWDRRRSG